MPPALRASKNLAAVAPGGANKIKIIFHGSPALGKNTSQDASVNAAAGGTLREQTVTICQKRLRLFWQSQKSRGRHAPGFCRISSSSARDAVCGRGAAGETDAGPLLSAFPLRAKAQDCLPFEKTAPAKRGRRPVHRRGVKFKAHRAVHAFFQAAARHSASVPSLFCPA